MFSQTVEYALRVVVYLAGLNGLPATTRQIAGCTKVPEGYLAKVLQVNASFTPPLVSAALTATFSRHATS